MRSTAFGSVELSVTGAFRITVELPSSLRSVTLSPDIRLMVYTPAGNVVLPAENSKGMLTSTLLGACACALTTANPKKMPKSATNLYVWFFITISFTYRTRHSLEIRLKKDFSRDGAAESLNSSSRLLCAAAPLREMLFLH